MAFTQTAYSDNQPIGAVGALATANSWDADTRTADGNIAFGTPVIRTGDHTCAALSARVLTATSSNGATAPAGATITASPTTTKRTKLGVYRLIVETAGATAKWGVYDPQGVRVGQAVTGTPATIDGLGFTITDSGTDPALGEELLITVTASAGGQLLGLARRDVAVVHTTPDRFEQYDSVPIVNRGKLFVTAGASVAAGEQAWWDEANGRFTNVATDYFLPGCSFDTSGVDGGVVVLNINVPK
jgi:hypothetical protein